MKSKASIIVLLVEIIAIVVFHTTKASRPSGIEATIQPPQQNHYSLADQKPQAIYTNLK